MAAAKKRHGGPSGKHLHSRRTLSGIPDKDWDAYAEHAEKRGTTRNAWIRDVLAEALAKQRKTRG